MELALPTRAGLVNLEQHFEPNPYATYYKKEKPIQACQTGAHFKTLNPKNVQLSANEAEPHPPPGHSPLTSEDIIGPSFLSFIFLQRMVGYNSRVPTGFKKKLQLPRK